MLIILSESLIPEIYSRKIAADPGFALAYNNQGWIFIMLAEYDLAIADFDKAVELYPDIAIGYYYRGLAYAGTGDYDSAIVDYKKVLDLSAEPELIEVTTQALSKLEC